MTQVTLWFVQSSKPELYKWCYQHPSIGGSITAVRGKTAGAYYTNATFQWTTALRALTALFLKARLAQDSTAPLPSVTIQGYRGSLASSLDDALYKEPNWLREMFGADAGGRAFARRVFCRTNPGQKRAGPVAVGLNTRFLENLTVRVHKDETEITSPAELMSILAHTESGELAQPPARHVPARPTAEQPPAARRSPISLPAHSITASLISSGIRQISFRGEWLQIANTVARETEHCLRGMVNDSDSKRWWSTYAGQMYMLSNLYLLEQGKEIRRIFVINSMDRKLREAGLVSACINELMGVKVRVMEDCEIGSYLPLPGEVFCVHDDYFAAIHQTSTESGQTRLVTEPEQVQALIEIYDRLFADRAQSISVREALRRHGDQKRVLREAHWQYSMLTDLSALGSSLPALAQAS